jgi:type IV pilus biogenesis protein CpaD/CtpE
MKRTLRTVLVICLTNLLSGCDMLVSYQESVSWHPTGSLERNLATEVVNPADLTHGQDVGKSDGLAAVAAIDRLRHDHVKALSDGSSTSSATPTASAGLTGSN